MVIGHSAGGTLSLWLSASKVEYSARAIVPHLNLLFKPSLCVAIAPIGDLLAGFHRRYVTTSTESVHSVSLVRNRLSDDGDAIQNYMKCNPDFEDEALSERSPYWLYDSSNVCV